MRRARIVGVSTMCAVALLSAGLMAPTFGEDVEPPVVEDPGPAPALDVGFHPTAPAPVLDTRPGGTPGRLAAGGTASATVGGVGELPSTGVGAVVLSVVAVSPTRSGELKVSSSGAPQPAVGQVAFTGRLGGSGTAVVPLGPDGGVSFANESSGTTHVVATVTGWFPEGGVYRPSTPTATPTVAGSSVPRTQLGRRATTELPVTGINGVPTTGVAAVALQVAVDPSLTPGTLTVWTTGTPRPSTTNVSFKQLQAASGLVFVAPNAVGHISISNSAGAVISYRAEVVGWFSADSEAYNALAPTQLIGASPGAAASSSTRIRPGVALDVAVTNRAGVPQAGVAAVVLQVTVSNATLPGLLRIWPTGAARSKDGTFAFTPLGPNTGLVVVRPGNGGRVSFASSAVLPVGFRLDVLGWLAPGENVVDTSNVIWPDPAKVVFDAYDPVGTTVLRYPTGTTFVPGNVVVMAPDEGHPLGLIGIVESVSTLGTNTAVTLSPGTIVNVMPVFDLNVDTGTEAQSFATHRQTLAAPSASAWSLECSGGFVNAGVGASLGSFNMRGDGRTPSSVWVEMTVQPKVNATLSFSNVANCGINRDLGKVTLPTIRSCVPVPVGCVPIWATQEIKFSVSGSVGVQFGRPSFTTSFGAQGRVGFRVGKNAGLISSWQRTAGPTPDLGSRVSGHVAISGSYEIKAYGVMGLGAGVGPVVRFDGPTPSYWARISAAIKGNLYALVKLKVLGVGLELKGELGAIELPSGGWTLWTLSRPAGGIGGDPNPQPPDPPGLPGGPITVSKGASAAGLEGCSSAACRWVDVSASGLPPNTNVTIVCRGSNGDEDGFWTYTKRTDSAGNGTWVGGSPSGCYYGYTGRTFWVTVNGVESERVVW